MGDSSKHTRNKIMDDTCYIYIYIYTYMRAHTLILTCARTHTHIHIHTHWMSPNSKSNWASLGGYSVPYHWKWVSRGGKAYCRCWRGESSMKYVMNRQPVCFPQTPRICHSGICSSSAIGGILHHCALHSVAHQRTLKYYLLEPVNRVKSP